MATACFTVGEVLSFAWGKFKAHAGFLLTFTVVSVIAYMLPVGLGVYFQESSPALSALCNLITLVVEVFLMVAWTVMSLAVADGKTPTWDMLTSHTGYTFKLVAAYIVYSVIAMVGFILLIVPGVIWSLQYQFFPYFVIDKNQGIMESLASSKAIAKGATGKLFVYSLAMIGLGILAAIPVFLGYLVLAPVSMVGSAYLYRKLSSTVATAAVTV